MTGCNGVAARVRAICGLAALLLVGTTALAGGHSGSAEDARQERLSQRLAAFSEAFATADVEVLATMLAGHYSHTNSSAPPLDREAWLDSMERRRADLESGELVVTSMETTDIQLGVGGNTAVVTGLSEMRGERGGEPFGLRIRFTNVWEWDGGDWYRVAFHDTYEPL